MASDATKQTINQSLIDLKNDVAKRTQSVVSGVTIPELDSTLLISPTDQLILETNDGTKRTTLKTFGDYVGQGLVYPQELIDARNDANNNYPQLKDRLDAMDDKTKANEQVIKTNEQNIQSNTQAIQGNKQEIADLTTKHSALYQEVVDARTDNKNPNKTHDNLKERLDSDYKELNDEIEKTNTQLSEVRKNSLPVINVLEWGATGDGVVDDTDVIQNLINLHSGKAVLYFPKSTYLIRDLTLKSRTIMVGEGRQSILKCHANSTRATLNIVGDVGQVYISNLSLNGKSVPNIHGIYIKNETFQHDTNHKFDKLYISLYKGSGIHQVGENSRSIFYDGLDVSNCGIGLHMEGTDNFIINSIFYWNKGNGIEIINGSSNKIVSTKSFGNSGIGLYLNGSVNQITNFESQDNFREGVKLYSCHSNQLSDLTSSTNGLENSNYSNIVLEKCYDTTISGLVFSRQTPQSTVSTSMYGLELKDSYYSDINLKTHCFNMYIIPMKFENISVSNNIVIDNVAYGIKNELTTNLGKAGSLDVGVSNYFTDFSKNDGYCELPANTNTQVIGLTNNQSTLPVILTKKITTIPNGVSYISLAWKGFIDTSIDNFAIETDLSFRDNQGGTISSSIKYDRAGGHINLPIPPGTSSINIRIALRPKVTNLNNSLKITSFMYGFM